MGSYRRATGHVNSRTREVAVTLVEAVDDTLPLANAKAFYPIQRIWKDGDQVQASRMRARGMSAAVHSCC